MDGTGMDSNIMTDSNIIADMRRTCIVRDMNTRAVLNIRPIANSKMIRYNAVDKSSVIP